MFRNLFSTLLLLASSQFAGVSGLPAGRVAFDTSYYNNYVRTMRKIDSLVSLRPSIASLETIAVTETGGRAVVAVKLAGTASSQGTTPAILFDGAHHGCEVLTSEVCLKLLAYLIAGYDSSPVLRRYIDSLRIFIVPLVNPDGHEVNFVTPDTLWRKNTRDNNSNGYWDPEDGVDLNRNYPFLWDIGGSPFPSDREYRGPYPLSEAETQGMVALCAREKFLTNICYHSSLEAEGWEKIYYPWDWGGVRSPDYDIIRPIAIALASSIPNLAGTGTYSAAIGNALSGGMYRNWSYYNYGVFSYTVETGIYYPSPAAAESICANNILGARYLLGRTLGSAVWGRVTDSVDGKPLAAQVLLLEVDTLSPRPILPRTSDSVQGRFFRLVNPGAYTFRVSRPGYVTKTVSVTVQEGQRSNLEVRLAKPSVTVVSPNGGESWMGGTTQTIRWRKADAGFATYRIVLSRDGGLTYADTIARNIPASETTFRWILSWVNSATCRIMVQALDSTGAFICQDVSDGNFVIQTAVTVLVPNGGEILGGGLPYTVRWRVIGTGFAFLRVLLSTNGGMTYTDTIGQVSVQESVIVWTPAWMNVNTCRIRVQALDSSGAVVVHDASDGNFAVRTAVTVMSPNGGEFWATGGYRTVRWTRTGGGFSGYRLLLSMDGGFTFKDTIARDVNPAESSFVWVIPTANSSTCWLMVQALDSAGGVVCQDASDGSFTIAGVVTVSVPNGGEVWAGNGFQNIYWKKTGVSFEYHRLLLSRNGGLTYSDTIAAYVAAAESSYRWQVFPVNTDKCRVCVQLVDASGQVVAADWSDLDFTIDSDPPLGFNLVRPANSAWASGTPIFIWNSARDNFGIGYYQLFVDGILRMDSIADTVCTFLPPALGEGLRTWTVKAVDRAGNARQSTQTFSVRIDTTPPGPFHLLAPAESSWISRSLSVLSWQASYDVGCGLAGYQLWIDGVPNRTDLSASQTSCLPVAPLSLGLHSWQVRAVDSVGNVRVSTQTRTFGVDTVPPEPFTLVLPDDSSWVSGRPRFVWHQSTDSLSGICLYRVYVSGTGRVDSILATDTSTVPTSTLAEGPATWYVQAIDRAGNIRHSPVQRIFVDTTPPAAFSLVSPSDGAYQTMSLPEFIWRQSTDAGVGFQKYELWIDGVRNRESLGMLDTMALPATALSEGIHVWQIRAYDKVANVRFSNQSRQVTLDWTPPDTFSLSFPRENDTTYVQQPVFFWRPARDRVSGLSRYQLLIDDTVSRDSIAESDTFAVLVSPLSFGSVVQWKVKAIDRAGLERQSSKTHRLYVVKDSIPPTIPIQVAPGHGTYCRDSAPTFRWRRSSDTYSGVSHYSLQYATNPVCSMGITVMVSDTFYQVPGRLADTVWYWRVRAHDRVGNRSDWSLVWFFEVDTRIPAAPMLQRPVRGAWCNSREVVFSWTPTSWGILSPVRYILQVDTVVHFTHPRTDTTAATMDTMNLLERKRYYWRVRAFDLAGNQGPFSAIDSFGVDADVPTVPAPVAPDSGGLLNDSLVRFVWRRSSDALSGVRHYVLQWAPDSDFVGAVTRDSVTDTTWVTTPPLIDTVWYWRVRAVDRAHNQSNWSSVWSFAKDATAPAVPLLLEPVRGSWKNALRTVFRWSPVEDEWQGSGFGICSPVRYIVQVDTLRSFVSPLVVDTTAFTEDTFELGERGRYYWRVRAFDLAGNQGYFSSLDSFGIDYTAPTSPIIVAPDSGKVCNDSVMRFVWSRARDVLSGVDHYQLQYGQDPELADSVTIDSLTDTTAVVALVDAIWYWRLRAVDRAGNFSLWSSIWNFEKDTREPEQPTLLSPVGGVWIADSFVCCNWSRVFLRGAGTGLFCTLPSNSEWAERVPLSLVRYILQIDTTLAFVRPRVDTLDDTTATVNRGEGRHFWRVRAFDLAGNQGAFSHVDSFGVDLTRPTVPMLEHPPDNFTLVDSLCTFIWHYAQDWPSGVADYRLQVASDTGFSRLQRDTVVADTSCRLLVADSVCYWRVRCKDRAGNLSNWSVRRRLRVIGPGAVVERSPQLLSGVLELAGPVVFRDRLVLTCVLRREVVVRLSLYNSAGREMTVFWSGKQPAGRYKITCNSLSIPAGIYFLSLDADGLVAKLKVVKAE